MRTDSGQRRRLDTHQARSQSGPPPLSIYLAEGRWQSTPRVNQGDRRLRASQALRPVRLADHAARPAAFPQCACPWPVGACRHWCVALFAIGGRASSAETSTGVANATVPGCRDGRGSACAEHGGRNNHDVDLQFLTSVVTTHPRLVHRSAHQGCQPVSSWGRMDATPYGYLRGSAVLASGR